VFVIVTTRFLLYNILGKSTGKVGILDGKKYNNGDICP